MSRLRYEKRTHTHTGYRPGLTKYKMSRTIQVKELCENQVIAFDDGEDFTKWAESDYYNKAKNWIGWSGTCKGT